MDTTESDEGKTVVIFGGRDCAVVFTEADGCRLVIPGRKSFKPDEEVPEHVLAITECMLRMSDPESRAELAADFMARA